MGQVCAGYGGGVHGWAHAVTTPVNEQNSQYHITFFPKHGRCAKLAHKTVSVQLASECKTLKKAVKQKIVFAEPEAIFTASMEIKVIRSLMKQNCHQNAYQQQMSAECIL